jgi:uncharacterized protein YjaG (DUF416 family)
MEINTQILLEEQVRDGIIILIDTICSKAAPIYPNLCKRANRSVDDKRKIVNMVFELIIVENSTMSPESAVAQIDAELGWNQE